MPYQDCLVNGRKTVQKYKENISNVVKKLIKYKGHLGVYYVSVFFLMFLAVLSITVFLTVSRTLYFNCFLPLLEIALNSLFIEGGVCQRDLGSSLCSTYSLFFVPAHSARIKAFCCTLARQVHPPL